jgi:hypothetical protein
MLGRHARSYRTSIPLNARKVQSRNQADAMDATQLAQTRARLA